MPISVIQDAFEARLLILDALGPNSEGIAGIVQVTNGRGEKSWFVATTPAEHDSTVAAAVRKLPAQLGRVERSVLVLWTAREKLTSAGVAFLGEPARPSDLVQHLNSPEWGFGFVDSADNEYLTIYFPDIDEVKIFNINDRGVRRVCEAVVDLAALEASLPGTVATTPAAVRTSTRTARGNPWLDMDYQAPPFVAPDDLEDVEHYNQMAPLESRLHTSLYPEPYLNPTECSILILNGNPGVSDHDLGEHRDPTFIEKSRDSLTLQPNREWPFFLLDPALEGFSGYSWWTERLGPLIRVVRNTMGCSTLDAQRMVARSVGVAELHPYHSIALDAEQLMTLASNSWTDALVGDALRRGALVVCFRGYSKWTRRVHGVARIAHVVSNPRRPYVSEGNLGGKVLDEIVRRVVAN